MGRGSPGILVRDSGFQDDDLRGDFVKWSGEDDHSALPDRAALDVENDRTGRGHRAPLRADRPHPHRLPVAYGRPGVLAGPPSAPAGLPGAASSGWPRPCRSIRHGPAKRLRRGGNRPGTRRAAAGRAVAVSCELAVARLSGAAGPPPVPWRPARARLRSCIPAIRQVTLTLGADACGTAARHDAWL